MLLRFILLAILTISPAVLHGYLTYRWSTPAELKEHADFLRAFPAQLGDWTQVNDAKPMTASVIRELGVTDYVSRTYACDDQSVLLSFLSGQTSRLIRHLPHICYGASGNTFLTPPSPVKITVDGVEHQFRVLPIRPDSAVSSDFVVIYGFAHDGQFFSPDRPRLAFHGEPAIEKIQILCQPDSESGRLDQIPEYAMPFVEAVCRHVHNSQNPG